MSLSPPSGKMGVNVGSHPLVRASGFGFLSDFGDSSFGIGVKGLPF
jgi:hypothetical protein